MLSWLSADFCPSVMWLVLIQVLGLAAAGTTRVCGESCRLPWVHAFFFACLGLVGTSMVHGLWLGPNYWSSSGATFCAMVLAAIWDVRGGEATG
jgi:hypothetical protein